MLLIEDESPSRQSGGLCSGGGVDDEGFNDSLLHDMATIGIMQAVGVKVDDIKDAGSYVWFGTEYCALWERDLCGIGGSCIE